MARVFRKNTVDSREFNYTIEFTHETVTYQVHWYLSTRLSFNSFVSLPDPRMIIEHEGLTNFVFAETGVNPDDNLWMEVYNVIAENVPEEIVFA